MYTAPSRAISTGPWKAFELREFDESDRILIGPLSVSFQGVPHFTDTYAMRLSSSNGAGEIVYGADCSPTEALTEFATGSDLMLIEATLPRPERTGERGHLTPREAGEHGRAAGVSQLVLTHISDELDSEWAREEAASAFQGPVEMAREGAVYKV